VVEGYFPEIAGEVQADLKIPYQDPKDTKIHGDFFVMVRLDPATSSFIKV
jgi:hypothetical protein